MSGLAFLGVAVVYLLIGVFVFFVIDGDNGEVDGSGAIVVAFWPVLPAFFLFIGVISAVAWLGCKLHDLIP